MLDAANAVFAEVVAGPIVATDAERAAAAERVAQLLGRNPASPLVAAAVTAVLDAINTERATAAPSEVR